MSSEPRHLFLFDWSHLVGRGSASRAEALCDGWSSRLRGPSPYQAAPFLGPSRTRVSLATGPNLIVRAVHGTVPAIRVNRAYLRNDRTASSSSIGRSSDVTACPPWRGHLFIFDC